MVKHSAVFVQHMKSIVSYVAKNSFGVSSHAESVEKSQGCINYERSINFLEQQRLTKDKVLTITVYLLSMARVGQQVGGWEPC